MPDDPTEMEFQARRCRRLAKGCGDPQTNERLSYLADDYERRSKVARDQLTEKRIAQPAEGERRHRHSTN